MGNLECTEWNFSGHLTCLSCSRLVALDTCVTSMTDTCTPTLASGFSARLQVLRGRCADPCAVTPLTAPLCRNGGVCNANQLTFTCACPTDWTGDQCETGKAAFIKGRLRKTQIGFSSIVYKDYLKEKDLQATKYR